ncbi:MAG: hypothetical protein ABIA12_02190 [Candidatus Aenigmatarchaeota archaeon]
MAWEITETLAQPLDAFFKSAVGFLPNLGYSVILLAIGWALGNVAGRSAKAIMVRFKLENYLANRTSMFKLSELVPIIFEWTVYLAFVQMSAQALGIAAIADFVNVVVGFIPGVAGTIAIFVVGYVFADYASEQIAKGGAGYSKATSKVLFWLIIYGTAAVSLPLVMVNTISAGTTLTLALVALEMGLAIAFGLGLKDVIASAAKSGKG